MKISYLPRLIIHWLKYGDRYVVVTTIISILAILLISLSFFIVYAILPERLPLFYSKPWGEDQLVSKEGFMILPLIILIISSVNLMIFSQLHPTQKILKRVLLLNSALVSVMAFITTVNILIIFI